MQAKQTLNSLYHVASDDDDDYDYDDDLRSCLSNGNLNWTDGFGYDYRVLGCDIVEPGREVLIFGSNLLPHFRVFTLNVVHPLIMKRRNSSVKLPGFPAHCAVNSILLGYILQSYCAPNHDRNRNFYENFVCFKSHGVIYRNID